MEAEADHHHQGRLRKGLGCIFESCGRFNVNLQSTQKQSQDMWGGVKNPSPTLPLSAAVTNCSNFKFLKGSPQPFFDFYGDLFWGTLYLVWRGDVFVQCT